MREAQAYVTKRFRERDMGRDSESERITFNKYLDLWMSAPATATPWQKSLLKSRPALRISPNGHSYSEANPLGKSIARPKTLQSRMCSPTEPIPKPAALGSVQGKASVRFL